MCHFRQQTRDSCGFGWRRCGGGKGRPYPRKSLTNQKYFVKTKHVFKKALMSSFFDEIESQFSGWCRLQSCTDFSYNP